MDSASKITFSFFLKLQDSAFSTFSGVDRGLNSYECFLVANVAKIRRLLVVKEEMARSYTHT